MVQKQAHFTQSKMCLDPSKEMVIIHCTLQADQAILSGREETDHKKNYIYKESLTPPSCRFYSYGGIKHK